MEQANYFQNLGVRVSMPEDLENENEEVVVVGYGIMMNEQA